MNTVRIGDIRTVDVEHGLGAATGKGFVKVRVEGSLGIALDNITPRDAVKIAQDLMYAAARAEYEEDIASNFGPDEKERTVCFQILELVRRGEARRLSTNTETQP